MAYRVLVVDDSELARMSIARLLDALRPDWIPLDPMIAAIEQARKNGARRLTFLGGEPTLHKGFFAALKRAVELRFEEIVIFTNGVLLPHPGFIDKVVALGSLSAANLDPGRDGRSAPWRSPGARIRFDKSSRGCACSRRAASA